MTKICDTLVQEIPKLSAITNVGKARRSLNRVTRNSWKRVSFLFGPDFLEGFLAEMADPPFQYASVGVILSSMAVK